MTMHLPIMVNLLTALGLGVLIGIERQWRQRAAGLRTNALVAVGSAAFVALATVVEGENSPTRIAAQVASGIGFLGAGVIMREGAG
jgi:putative Mg2+ transporter-C (MgtC) family protein